VLHAPQAAINKAWGLALRSDSAGNSEFRAAGGGDRRALLLSLGPQHSFPLADVFSTSIRDGKGTCLQALLDAPLFQTRWRWNTTISLAVPRFRGAAKVPAAAADAGRGFDGAVFPDAAACLETFPATARFPITRSCRRTIRDCLTRGGGFRRPRPRVLTRIHAGELRP
jgi:ATP-dependent Lhr-like helicase